MFFVFGGVLIRNYLGSLLVLLCFAVFMALFVFFYMRRKIWAWYVVFPVLLLAGAWRIEYAEGDGVIYGEEYVLTGRVCKIIEKDESIQIYLANGMKTILLYSYDPESLSNYTLMYGDVISCGAKLLEFDTARNPGNFDSRAYYLSQNVICKASVTGDITVLRANNNPWIRLLFAFKEKLKKSYDLISMDNDAGIYKSVVLGDKTELDSDIKELYRLNGMAHILAISGLHISIIGMSLYKLQRKCCIPFAPAAVVCTVLIVSYAILTGSSISAIRAVIMFLMAVYANVCGRKYDLISAMSFSVAVTLLVYPYVFLNSGFWLSYLAIAGIVLIRPVFDRFFGLEIIRKELIRQKKKEHGRINKKLWLKEHIIGAFNASLAVSLATMPVILCSYYEIPLYGVLLNMIVIPLMTFVMLGAVLGGVLGIVNVSVGVFFAGISHYILGFYELMCTMVMKLPGAVLTFGCPYWWEIALFYALIILSIVLSAVKCARYALIAVVSGISLIPRINDSYIRMVDVGQGDCIHISYAKQGILGKLSLLAGNNAVNILIDGGSSNVSSVGEYRIEPYLKSLGIKSLDYVIMSHADSDHVNGLLEIIESGDIEVKCFIMPQINVKTDNYLTVEEKVLQSTAKLMYMSKGDSIAVNTGSSTGTSGLEITCVHPDADYVYSDENDYSLVLNVTLDDMKCLFTGDIGQTGENYMLKTAGTAFFELSDIDILKVGHHGSKYSSGTAFLSVVKPEIAIISAGVNNRYSHPHKASLERLEEIQSEIYVTNTDGAITIKNINGEIKVWRYLDTE